MLNSLRESISGISEKISLPVLLGIIGAVFMLIVIAFISIHVHNKSKAKKRRAARRIKCDFGDSGYRSEILSSLPTEEQLDFSNLYRRIDELQTLINQNKRQLELQGDESLGCIERKIQDSQSQIKNKWNYLRKKRYFHHCICVHYASFTLADSIKRQQESREYIISNFGEKGKAWGERLKKRKADLVGDS